MPASESKPSWLWASLIGVGLVLIAAGFYWQSTSDASQWLEREDAEQYVESAVKLHGQTMGIKNQNEQAEPTRIVLARRELAESVAKIESARFKQRWLPRGLQALGALFALSGVLGQKLAQKG